MDFTKYDNKKPFPTLADSKEERRKVWMEYQDEDVRLRLLFKHDLEVEFGLIKASNFVKDTFVDLYPRKKIDLLFEIAWDKEHSSGYKEVYYEYETLLDLVK